MRQQLDTNFEGTTYESILWHSACHYRAQQIGPKSRDLMALTGAEVTMVERCSAIDGTWGLRAENVEMARRGRQAADGAGPRIRRRSSSPATASSPTSRSTRARGKRPIHPLQVLARAYGIEEDDVRKLTVDDIVDMRAYERERDELPRSASSS